MIDILALIILIIGGIDLGILGIFNFNAVSWIFGGETHIVSRIIYTLVGVSALWCISFLFRDNRLIDRDSRKS